MQTWMHLYILTQYKVPPLIVTQIVANYFSTLIINLNLLFFVFDWQVLVKTPEDQCSKVNCSHPIARCEVINKTATCVCPTIVTLELFLVCGSDGVTYPNPGTLDIASCNSGGAIEKVKDGKCKWDAETDQCQK